MTRSEPDRSQAAAEGRPAGTASSDNEMSLCPPKVKPIHLARRAIVYVRQSTPQQVAEHKESTARQYALVGRAARSR